MNTIADLKDSIGDVGIEYYKKKTLDFITETNAFCDKHKIPRGINNVLSFKSGICVGPGWGLMYKAPRILLAASKSFEHFRNNLDPDFANEILTKEDIHAARIVIANTPELKILLSNVLGNDFKIGVLSC